MGGHAKSTKENGRPGLPEPPPRALSTPKVVTLEGEVRLRMEKMLLERNLLEERKKNLQHRVDDLAREADVLNKEVATNGRLRDEFLAARGFDIAEVVEYGDGKLTGKAQAE
jgi:hypothetical protein